MIIEGVITGTLINTKTGEKREAFTQKNHIQTDKLAHYANSQIVSFTGFGDNLFASENDPGIQRRDWKYLWNATIATTPGGVTSPEFRAYQAGDVHRYVYSQEIAANGTHTRTWNMFGITDAPDQAAIDGFNASIHAVVRLALPCVQGQDDTLVISYRLQVPYDPDFYTTGLDINTAGDMSPEEIRIIAQKIFEGGANFLQITTADIGHLAFAKMNPRKLKHNFDPFYALNAITTTGVNQSDTTTFKHKIRQEVPINTAQGLLIGSTIHGLLTDGTSNDDMLLFGKNIREGTTGITDVQGIYGHSATALGPFYDINHPQVSNLQLTINGSAWSNPDYPKLLKLKMISGGINGVGTYQFQYRNQLGFVNNTYDNRPVALPGFASLNNHYTDGFNMNRSDYGLRENDLQRFYRATIEKIDTSNIVAAFPDELCIANVLTQRGKRFATGTTPAMPATEIGQVLAASDGGVWAACRNTGLYRINAAQDTVGTFTDGTTGLTGATGCYGVCETSSGRIWGFFDGATPGLYYTDNNGVSWTNVTFSHTNGSWTDIDTDPTVVKHLKGDLSHVDHRIAVGYTRFIIASQTEVRIAWWDTTMVSGIAIEGPIVNRIYSDYPNWSNHQSVSGSFVDLAFPLTYSNTYSCSPNDGFWFCCQDDINNTGAGFDAFRLNFGSATTDSLPGTDIATYNPHQMGWGVDENGNDAAFYLTLDGQENNMTARGTNVIVMARSDLTHDAYWWGDSVVLDSSQQALCYLGEGIMLCAEPAEAGIPNEDRDYCNYYLLNVCPNEEDVGNFENEMYPTYGWNVSAWERGHAGAKTLHAAAETLIDGITVAFDDASGTEPSIAGEYYTCGVFDGIQMDGATLFNIDVSTYFKTVLSSTDIEVPTIPTPTKVPHIFTQYIPSAAGDWQDATNLTFDVSDLKTASGTSAQFHAGARSAVPAIVSTAGDLQALTRLPGYKLANIQGYIEFNFITQASASFFQRLLVGLSDNTVLGTAFPIDTPTVQFGVMATSLTTSLGNMDLEVLEDFTTQHVLHSDIENSHSQHSDDRVRLILIDDGSIIVECLTPELGWSRVKTIPAGTVNPLVDMYMDVAFSHYNGYGIEDIAWYNHPSAGRYLYLGNQGNNTGVWHPNFDKIDLSTLVVTIGGTVATPIAAEDTDTVLAAGEYSAFADGLVRLSDADIGESIAVSYKYTIDES